VYPSTTVPANNSRKGEVSVVDKGPSNGWHVLGSISESVGDYAEDGMDAPDAKSLPENAYKPLAPGEIYTPIVPAGAKVPEASGRAVAWGLFLCVIFTVASTPSRDRRPSSLGGSRLQTDKRPAQSVRL
jgi:hypothetical protein